MSPTSCEIYFDNNPSRVFYGGQLLSGRVVLKLFKEKTVRGIYIKIIGRAYCEWSTGSGKNRETHIGEEYYLNERTFFVGGSHGKVVVPPGEYNYTFRCMLPVALPTSVEGNTGFIRYTAIVNLDRPMWPDQEFDISFTVLKPVNLNDNIALRYPLVKQERKTFYICCFFCCCCETDPVFINARIPVAGYTPGQTIELFLEINNKSDQTFTNFEIKIMKHIQYYTSANSSDTTFDDIILKTTNIVGCQQNQAKTYTVNISVPPVPPTDESTSNIVKVSYQLRIQGSANCWRNNPVLHLPITIGTYPILLSNTLGRNSAITQQPTSLAPSNNTLQYNTFQSTTHRTAPSFSTIPDSDGIDPPTFEEATSGHLVGVNGKTFKPSYPVYRRTPSYCDAQSSN